MNNIDQLQERIKGWHHILNHPDTLPDKAFRRNAQVYELTTYVNHVIACYLSEYFDPIKIMIDRARIHMKENPSKDIEYCSKIESYFKDLELFLGYKANVTKL